MAAILSQPDHLTGDILSGLSAAANFRNGFGRSSSSRLPEVVEEDGDAVHVAVGKSVEKMVSLLQWAFRTFQGKEICLLHVHRPSPRIPTLLGKLPAKQANPETLAAFRDEEKEETRKLLSNYLMTCRRSNFKASTVTIEGDKVHKGIVDLVNLHAIQKLVIGAIPDCVKGKKISCEASYISKHAPSFCEIWFVKKGKLIWTRKASGLPVSLLTPAIPWSLRSRSLHLNKNKVEVSQTDPSMASCSYDPLDGQNVSFSTSSIYDSGCSTTAEPGVSSSSSALSLEERLEIQLAELKLEADESKEAKLRLLNLQNLVPQVADAFNKVTTLEMAHSREVKLRTDAEDVIRITNLEQEKLTETREELTEQLQKTMRNIALLDTRAHEANRRRQEVATELKIIQASISTLRQEKHRLQWQKMEAMRWLDRWRNRVDYEEEKGSKYSSSMEEEISEIPIFSLSDLETATCNFSESFRIGQGGYGVVYKGEMLGKTIAIKRLHWCNMQRQAEVHNMVQVLGRLHHPRLVELIGVCPESWCLVYEYMPGGSLQNYLCNDNSICALNWKARTQIVADIASGLLFLHSSRPQIIVHGNLKPENVLLDCQYRCKISDYGDHMLISRQTLRCPSFRRCAAPTGAFSYTDPESNRIGALTHKSDVYSFGLIILQLVTGKTLIGEVRRAVSDGNLASILDLSAGEWSTYVARRLVELGLQCCELNSRDRPELTPSLVTELEHLPFLEERTAPYFFLCPILQEIMHDPQVAADGFTYEGEALRGWLGSGHETSPMTNLKLSHLNLTPNHALRLAIRDWLCES